MASFIANLLTGNVFDGISKVIDSIRGSSPEQAAQLETLTLQVKAQLQQAQVSLQEAQLGVNKAEASSGIWFVAGWRPLIGYICAAGLATQFIIAPLATWGSAIAHHPVVFPSLDLGTLMTLLMGMLGLGGMRTVEKLQGAQGNH